MIIFCFVGRSYVTQSMSSEIWIGMEDTSHIYIFTVTYLDYILFSFLMCWLSSSFEDRRVLEPIPGFSHVVKSHTELNIDLNWNSYLEFHIWNLDLHPAYNKCNITIWLLWCSNRILYKPLSWTLSTLKSSKKHLHTRNSIYNKFLHTENPKNWSKTKFICSPLWE